jgi:hypothetical protein
MHARRALLLIPLLAAGCATAGQSTSSLQPVDANAPVHFERVTSRAAVVQVKQPVQAAFLYVRPGNAIVTSWAGERAVQTLAAGPHRVALERPLSQRLALATASQASGRSRPAVQAPGPGQRPGGLLLVDRGRSGARGPAAAPAAQRTLFVLVSPRPLDQALLEEILAEFNEDYAGISVEAGALSQALSERLAADIPGATGYFTRLPD